MLKRGFFSSAKPELPAFQPFNKLPPEIKAIVLKYFTPEEQLELRRVSKEWKGLIEFNNERLANYIENAKNAKHGEIDKQIQTINTTTSPFQENAFLCVGMSLCYAPVCFLILSVCLGLPLLFATLIIITAADINFDSDAQLNAAFIVPTLVPGTIGFGIISLYQLFKLINDYCKRSQIPDLEKEKMTLESGNGEKESDSLMAGHENQRTFTEEPNDIESQQDEEEIMRLGM